MGEGEGGNRSDSIWMKSIGTNGGYNLFANLAKNSVSFHCLVFCHESSK